MNLRRVAEHRSVPQRAGAMIVLFAILLPTLLILSAFAVNFAWMELSRTQTFIAADAAARAAGRTYALSGNLNKARAQAGVLAAANPVAGRTMKLSNSDFIVGTSTRSTSSERFIFAPGGAKPNALKISIRQLSASANGQVPFLLPGIVGGSGYEVTRSAVSTRVEVDIALVIDRSGSMAYAANEKAVYPPLPAASPPGWYFGQPAPNPSRWRDLAAAANVFIDELDRSVLRENVALVTYGDSATIDRSTTTDYTVVRSGIDVYTRNFPSGKTNIGDGIQKGVSALATGASREAASKVLIVMTDGIRNIGPNPVTAATNAGKQGIIIFTVTFAAEADQSTMKKVAAAGNGAHFHATSASQLATVLETIVRIIPTILTE